MRFAHLKTHHGFERMRLRGLSGARDEFHLAAIVQNLKTLALRLIRPPPRACLRVSCVASVGGVSVEADARTGEAKARSAQHLPHQTSGQTTTALAADFFDSIGQFYRSAEAGRQVFHSNLTNRCHDVDGEIVP